MLFYEIKDQVKILGRGALTADGLEADWSAAGFELALEGKGVLTLTLDASSPSYFRAFFDGEPELERTYVPQGESRLKYYLAEGVHTFRLVKSTSVRDGFVNFKELDFDGQLLPAPGPKKKYIEFVGVSYACGSGVLGKAKDAVNKRYHDATLAYPYLVAQALDADLSVAAVGGAGIVNSYNASIIPPCYLCRGPIRDPNTPYDFTRRCPDLVFIDVGANDGGRGTTEEQFYNELYRFSKKILELNKGCKVMFQLHPRYREQIAQVADKLLAEGYPIYTMQYTWPKMLGAAKHPNVEEHQKLAREIVEELKKVL